MSRKKNRFIGFAGQVMKQLHDFDFAWEIEESGRLIQINDRCLLSQSFGDHCFLTFTVT